MANKLNIVNGVIQDGNIAGYPLHKMIVTPKGARNVRTLLKITPNAICYHNTANTSPTADDLNHARYLQNLENGDTTYLSVHFFVDQDSITQCIPVDEMAYHAGTALGNKTSIGIEICENGDIFKAEKIAQQLGASLLLTYPTLAIKKHQDYSGKYCPRVILSRNGWSKFVEDIKALTKPKFAVQTTTLESGYYIIASKLNGKVLTQNGDTELVTTNQLTGLNNQVWEWNGKNFANRGSGKRLDISGGDIVQGKPAIIWTAHDGLNQQFNIGVNGEIIAKHSNMVLDIKESNQNNKAEVVQWPPHGGLNQQWIFIAVK